MLSFLYIETIFNRILYFMMVNFSFLLAVFYYIKRNVLKNFKRTRSFYRYIDEYKSRAVKKLNKSIYAYFSGGSDDELTLKENCSAYDRIKLVPRVLANVASCDASTKVLDSPLSFPLIIAPTAFHKLAHPEGELITAKAASKAGIIMTISSCSTTSLKSIRDVSVLPPWFQLYVYKDRSITQNLILKASELNYGAIVVTVDAPLYAKRPKEIHHPLTLLHKELFENLMEAGLSFKGVSTEEIPQFLAKQLDPDLNWDDIEWIRSQTDLPVVLKGILHPEDIKKAKYHGVKTIVISNHGGRQLDTAITALEALKNVDAQLKEEMEIIVDGGIRKGVDILKAIALGAKAVMIGRPVLWGLACEGEQGILNVLNQLKEELLLSMALSGISRIGEITEDILYKQQSKE